MSERYVLHDDKQGHLLQVPPNYEQHWVGMPEFVQERQEPYQKIIVRFSCHADVDDFAARLGQKITTQTKDMWHPALIVRKKGKSIVSP